MSGRWLPPAGVTPHRCDLPRRRGKVGAWQCDCGKVWILEVLENVSQERDTSWLLWREAVGRERRRLMRDAKRAERAEVEANRELLAKGAVFGCGTVPTVPPPPKPPVRRSS